jgi:hypothetical protein
MGRFCLLLRTAPSKQVEEMMSLTAKCPADIDALLHPARAFRHPSDVVRDNDLTLYEKRAILSSWASDACAVEDIPELRQLSGVEPVKFDDIMDALRELDLQLERRVFLPAKASRRERSGSDHSGNSPLF